MEHYNFASHLLFFLLSITFFSRYVVCLRLVNDSNGNDLISEACRHTQFLDVCVSSLQSQPESRSANLQGVAEISLELSIAQAKETIPFIRKLIMDHTNDTNISSCLSDCLDEYGDALDDLHTSISALKQQSFDTVDVMVAGAMANSDSCESGFQEEGGVKSPLTERNHYFEKLCSNALAITKLCRS